MSTTTPTSGQATGSEEAPVAAVATDSAPGRHEPSAAARLLGPLVVLAAAVALMLMAFALPGLKAAPRDLPLGVAGPEQVSAPISERLSAEQPGAFEITAYPDEQALRAAIENRAVYGGIIAGPSGIQVLTASAASPAVAQQLSAVATTMAEQSGQPVSTTDVVPLPDDDPRGVGLAASVLPIVVGALAPVTAYTRMFRDRWVRLGAVVLGAVTLGLTAAAVLHYGFGSLDGNYLIESLALAATLGALGVMLLGLYQVAGYAGLGLGAVVAMFLGNPLSGAAGAPHLLSPLWREVGQWIPLGAGNQLLRSVTFFDGAALSKPLLVLGIWTLAGLILIAVGRRQPDGEPAGR